MRRIAVLTACMTALLFLLPAGSASGQQVRAFPGFDCKESPTPGMPGQGLASFFEKTPDPLPAQADPFAPGATTTIYEQYGYAGLRWHTYDLGCGPDAARNPDAVIGTALANWTMNGPIALTALTSSLTEVAFHPTFLSTFDPVIGRVSDSLHRSLFATWVPAVIALLGLVILLKARRSALATTAASIGWALMVVLVATALFRWPIAAGHFADNTVTNTLGSVVDGMDGNRSHADPGITVASSVEESIFYKSWLAGTLGSTDSPTAKRYGSALFKAQALTWREAYVVEHDPARGKQIIETKQDEWKTIASKIEDSDPEAYENLTGRRSDTRVGYAILSGLAAFLALPFLLISSLLLIGSFLIVRLAVMMFPAFATLGVFPAGRGLILGIARTVGAALVNAVIFGIGAAITVTVLGLIFDPASSMPGWLSLVLMPLFGFVMWVALRPFRRLTAMVSPNTDPFGDAAGSVGGAAHSAGRWTRKAAVTAAGVYTGNVAAAATVSAMDDDPTVGASRQPDVPERVEATQRAADPGMRPLAAAASVAPPSSVLPPLGVGPTSAHESPAYLQRRIAASDVDVDGTHPGVVASESAPLPPIEPEWVDGEEVFNVYRPTSEDADDAA